MVRKSDRFLSSLGCGIMPLFASWIRDALGCENENSSEVIDEKGPCAWPTAAISAAPHGTGVLMRTGSWRVKILVCGPAFD